MEFVINAGVIGFFLHIFILCDVYGCEMWLESGEKLETAEKK
jgi:hypothetical protein